MTTTNTMPVCWQDFHDLLDAGVKRLILLGQPGTGKTYGAMTYGANGAPVNARRLICTEDMTSLDVSGGYLPNANGGFDYVEGQALKAWREGARLIVDEADRANGDVLSLLLAFCDSTESSVFVRPDTGERVTPHAGFSAIITSNVERKDDLPPALADRFPVALTINEPHPNALAQLPEDLRALAQSLVSAPAGRRASLRAFAEYAKVRTSLGEARALRLVFGEELAVSITESLTIARMVEVN